MILGAVESEMRNRPILCPWSGAFAAGRTRLGMLLIFMQVSLVLWPTAVRAARRLEAQRVKQIMLDQLALEYAFAAAQQDEIVTGSTLETAG